MRNLLLQIPEIAHVLEVKTHVSRKDIVDHQLAHGAVCEGVRPIAAQYLRVSGTMKGFKNGAVVVQLSQRSIEGYKKSVVDTRVTYVVSDSGDEKREGIEWLQKLCYR
jgi:hypothetical protein